MRFPRPLAALALLLAAACGVLEPEEEVVITLFVAPETAECTALVPRSCLLVREHEEDDWGLFYDAIEGFRHEPGYRYELRVLRREVEDPPADGSSAEYELLEVVSRTAA